MERILETMTTCIPTSSMDLSLAERVLTSLDEWELQKARWYNEKEGCLNVQDGVNCPICKNKGHVAYYTPEQGQFLEICKCNRMREAVRLMKKSGLYGSIRKFDEFVTPEKWQENIKQKALNFVSQKDARCFFIGGQSGSGKTHICTAITREYLLKCCSLRYIMWAQTMEELRDYSNENRFSQADEYASVDVLYVDDFFKPTGSKPTGSTVLETFKLVDRRYKQPSKITIISSELTLSEINNIDQAIAGRIYEMAGHGKFILSVPRGAKYNYRMGENNI